MIVCKQLVNGTLNVQRLYSSLKKRPILLSNSNPTLGLSSINASYSNGNIECLFVREKSKNLTNYFDLSQSYYIMTAVGNVDINGNYFE